MPEQPARTRGRATPAPTHPALELLSKATSALSAGVFSESAMDSVVGLLKESFAAHTARLWVREGDGTYRAFAAQGDEPSAEDTRAMSTLIGAGQVADRASAWDAMDLRVPLDYDSEHLGMLELRVPRDGREGMARDVLEVLANVLVPLLASKELSKDLAFEVARRAREIEEQRRFTAKVIDSLPVGLYVIDRQYRVQAWNRKRETGTQGIPREQALGRLIFEVLPRLPKDRLQREFDEVFASGKVQVYESVGEDGRQYRVTKIPMRQNDAEISHLITIGEDVTEWKDVQGQIAQSEKLAAIGQLAAGIMHEINNPLATIGACVDAVAGYTNTVPADQRAKVEEYLGIMDSEVERCKRIVNNLLDLSRPRVGRKAEEDVNTLMDETLLLLKHHDRFKGLEIVRRFAPDLPPVHVSKDQIIQVFMALMLNAADAMQSAGTLTVTTRRNPERHDEIVISFSDTGSGIPNTDLKKIFEPFYTTKPQGRGTGLGLSICYTIIADHRGRIDVDSTLGRGTTFSVFLPASDA